MWSVCGYITVTVYSELHIIKRVLSFSEIASLKSSVFCDLFLEREYGFSDEGRRKVSDREGQTKIISYSSEKNLNFYSRQSL